MHRSGPVPLRLLKRLRDQIDRSALEIFPEVLVPSQFPALVPGQQLMILSATPSAVRVEAVKWRRS